MTTIAARVTKRFTEIAADRLCTKEEGRIRTGTIRKLCVGNGFASALAGSQVDNDMWAEFLARANPPAPRDATGVRALGRQFCDFMRNECNRDYKSGSVIVFALPTGIAMLWLDDCACEFRDTMPAMCVQGSGHSHAYAVMCAGHGVRTALRVACELDTASGAPVDYARIPRAAP